MRSADRGRPPRPGARRVLKEIEWCWRQRALQMSGALPRDTRDDKDESEDDARQVADVRTDPV